MKGRVRVQLKQGDGKPVIDDIPTRKALFLEVAKLLPRHPNRQPKPKEEAKPAPATSKSKHGGGKKKKGKK